MTERGKCDGPINIARGEGKAEKKKEMSVVEIMLQSPNFTAGKHNESSKVEIVSKYGAKRAGDVRFYPERNTVCFYLISLGQISCWTTRNPSA